MDMLITPENVQQQVQEQISEFEQKMRDKVDTYYDKQKVIGCEIKDTVLKIKNKKIQDLVNKMVEEETKEIAEERHKVMAECGFYKHKIQVPKFKAMWEKSVKRGKRRTERIKYLNKLVEVLADVDGKIS